jgi:hypothetical protein
MTAKSLGAIGNATAHYGVCSVWTYPPPLSSRTRIGG